MIISYMLIDSSLLLIIVKDLMNENLNHTNQPILSISIKDHEIKLSKIKTKVLDIVAAILKAEEKPEEVEVEVEVIEDEKGE